MIWLPGIVCWLTVIVVILMAWAYDRRRQRLRDSDLHGLLDQIEQEWEERQR